jgi:hypothetical protein
MSKEAVINYLMGFLYSDGKEGDQSMWNGRSNFVVAE